MNQHDNTNDDRWQAVLNRDAAFNGRFVYSVKTTGVYCRPGCPARRPARKNVAFYESWQDAERAGFRPCLRCTPNSLALAEKHATAIAAACKQIEEAHDPLSLNALAHSAGMSPYHFHRIFKAITGLTPKAYSNANRQRRVHQNIRTSETITQVVYESGFNASSRFYASADANLGMRPRVFRAGGKGAVIHFAIGQSSLGAVLVAATPKGVCAILIGDDPEVLLHDLEDRFPKATLAGGDAQFEQWTATAIGLVENPAAAAALPLDIQGTVFQQRVWQTLQAIPPGTTATYTDIAHQLGKPNAVRAVASACAANPLAVAVPCHRVVRSDGSMAGYRWGIERKRKLLSKEKEETSL